RMRRVPERSIGPLILVFLPVYTTWGTPRSAAADLWIPHLFRVRKTLHVLDVAQFFFVHHVGNRGSFWARYRFGVLGQPFLRENSRLRGATTRGRCDGLVEERPPDF